MPKNKWITPEDAPSGSLICRRLRLPDDPAYLALLMGALDDLTFPGNFEQLGGITPDEAATAFATMYDTIEDCSMIGQIVAYATTNPPTGTLACDGATHLRTDYPALYSAIASAYHDDADHFHTPDLRGRSIIGAGQGTGLTSRTIAQSIGEETHQVTLGEMPSHGHAYSYPVSLPLGAPGSPAGVIGSVITTGTTNAGGDGAHNNIQPSHVLNYAIFFE